MPTITPALAARRKAVFAACRQLGMDDDARHTMLKSMVGVESTTQLTLSMAQTVLDHLRKASATRPKPVRAVARHPGYPEHVRRECGALVDKIEAQLADMGLSWEYARQILRRVSGGWKQDAQLGKEAFRFAEADDLKKVVAALAYEQEKRSLLDDVTARLARAGLDETAVPGMEGLAGRISDHWRRKPVELRLVRAALLSREAAQGAGRPGED